MDIYLYIVTVSATAEVIVFAPQYHPGLDFKKHLFQDTQLTAFIQITHKHYLSY
jgi:hypothetical protein